MRTSVITTPCRASDGAVEQKNYLLLLIGQGMLQMVKSLNLRTKIAPV